MTMSRKTALVTGGSRGIGAAIVRRLAHDGLTVLVNYAGNDQAARTLIDEITQAGGQAIAAKGDIADPAAVHALFDLAESAHGGVDILINSAGIMELSPIAALDDAMIDRLIDVNLKGTLNVLREGANRLHDGGRIVTFSTSVVRTRFENYGLYAATKSAVETLSAILARELRGRRITVNAVAPGPTATDLFLKGKSDELVARLAKANPLERLGHPDDIANVVAFLVGPQGEWVNGQVLRANGGMV